MMTPANESKLKLSLIGTGSLILLLGVLSPYMNRTPPSPAQSLAASTTRAAVWRPASQRMFRRFKLSALHSPLARLIHRNVSALAKAPSELNFFAFNKVVTLHSYRYIFEGKATNQGVPCGKASVLAQLETPGGMITKGAITENDGFFRIEIPFKAAENDPVDYVINAYTSDFKKVEIIGRRIVMPDDVVVTIESSLALLPADHN